MTQLLHSIGGIITALLRLAGIQAGARLQLQDTQELDMLEELR